MNEKEKINFVKTLNNLPFDMVREIFSKLTPLNLARLEKTSRSHRNLLYMDSQGQALEKHHIHVYRLLKRIEHKNIVTKIIKNYFNKDVPHYLRPTVLDYFFKSPEIKQKIYNFFELAKSNTNKKYFEELKELLKLMSESTNGIPKNIIRKLQLNG